MLQEVPCKSCKKRHLKCHSTCEDFIAFDKARKAENEKINAERRKYHAPIKAEQERMARLKKMRGK